MKNLSRAIIASSLLMTSIGAIAETHDRCPANVVNFWKNYVINTEDYSAVPDFLISNDCLRAVGVSTDFHTAMVNRFDHPENPQYLDQLYAQLDWYKPSTIAEQ